MPSHGPLIAARKSTVRRLADHPPPTPQPTPCRLWQGPVDPRGYGRRPSGSQQLVHRWVWEQAEGSIPAGMRVLHRCDQPLCFRFEHLFLGTDRDNFNDMVSKGRARLLTGQPGGAGHVNAKLSASDVEVIRASSDTQSVLAQRYGVAQSTISRIRAGHRWKD